MKKKGSNETKVLLLKYIKNMQITLNKSISIHLFQITKLPDITTKSYDILNKQIDSFLFGVFYIF